MKLFLEFCAKHYEAKHYMLFILGHGLVVGNDVFLFDEHAEKHSLKLKDLGTVLKGFKKQIGKSEFDLVSFHSCSMSGLEIAYELENTANYMLAAQGPAYVGSWPYTQILMRIFNDIDDQVAAYEKAAGKQKDDRKGKEATRAMRERMLENIFHFVVHNSTDFMLAGYSFDLCLCDLRKISNPAAEKVLKNWATALTRALAKTGDMVNSVVQNCILLAHWKAQSYWQENYTDLYDFCFCLSEYCDDFGKASGNPKPLSDIKEHCTRVMEVLARRSDKFPDNAVLQAEYAGPDGQYSHGLSIYFPWAAPVADKSIAHEYEGSKAEAGYRFNDVGWYGFLRAYWGKEPGEGTKRKVHKAEGDKVTPARPSTTSEELLEDMVSLMFNDQGPLNKTGALDDDPPPQKTKPPDPTGDECTCGSIKNYPRDTRPRRERSRIAFDQLPPSSTDFL